MKNEFRSINGYENYEVSANGKVRSTETKKYKQLCKDRAGRAVVVIHGDTGSDCLYVSDLIEEHFGKPEKEEYLKETNEPDLPHIESIMKHYRDKAAEEEASRASEAPTPVVKKERRRKRLLCNETGEEFATFSEAAKHFGVGYDQFYNAIYNNGKYKDYTFSRI